MDDSLQKKYSSELKAFDDKTFEKRWIAMLGDLSNLCESNWDFASIRYETVMNNKEWEEFAFHPERVQYKSKIERLKNSDFISEVFPFIVEVLKDSLKLHELTIDPELKDGLRQSIGTLFDYSLNARYQVESLREADIYIGRSVKQRDSGEINPTEMLKNRFEYAIYEYCRYHDKDYIKTKEQIYKICDGRPDTLRLYYYSCDMEREIREMIWSIFGIMRRDLTLSFASIQLGWEIWKIANEIGFDTDKWLQFIGFLPLKETKKNLLEMLNDGEIKKELEQHLKDDLPETYKKYQVDGYADAFEITHENAARKKLPKSLKSNEELEQMIKESEDLVYKIIPLGKRESARYLILNPTHPAATTRAFQSGTKNENEELVSVIVMTPRVSPKDQYLRTLAHEVTHAIHKVILVLGEKSGVLEKGSTDKVPGGVMEDFSQLVDHQFSAEESLPYKKVFKGKEFPNFNNGYSVRHQAAFALVQISIRESFDKLWRDGYRKPLTERIIRDLKSQFDNKLFEWYSLGFNVKRDELTAFDWFAPYSPDDGLVYLKKYLVKSDRSDRDLSKSESNESDSSLSMSDAFNQRFGEKWIESKDAKKILYWLLLETGRNHRSEQFGKFIIEKSPEECWKELLSIGVKESDL